MVNRRDGRMVDAKCRGQYRALRWNLQLEAEKHDVMRHARGALEVSSERNGPRVSPCDTTH